MVEFQMSFLIVYSPSCKVSIQPLAPFYADSLHKNQLGPPFLVLKSSKFFGKKSLSKIVIQLIEVTIFKVSPFYQLLKSLIIPFPPIIATWSTFRYRKIAAVGYSWTWIIYWSNDRSLIFKHQMRKFGRHVREKVGGALKKNFSRHLAWKKLALREERRN